MEQRWEKMHKKIHSIMIFTLLFMSIWAFSIQPVRAIGTIYIRPDGSIDPSTAPISTVDNVTYIFTDDIYDSIVVERDNIIVDGAGYNVQGTGAYPSKGMELSGRTNMMVRNTHIKNFYYGIWLSYSSNNSISGNNIANNRCGIFLGASSNNSVGGNNITANNLDGIKVSYSSNNSVGGNNITGNNWDGISLSYSSNNSISGNHIENNWDGISLDESCNNSVSGNNITGNNWDGIELCYYSKYNSISGNNIAANNYEGICVEYSSNNNITGNNITASNWCGITLWYSSNYNGISENDIANNNRGVYLFHESSNNTVSRNTIINNENGVFLYGVSDNMFYHNNFIDNTKQVYIYTSGCANIWDNGYPSGGNYWSDYEGSDIYSGPYQNETGGDEIGDAPYVIDDYNQDNYPLMKPWTPPPITATMDVNPDALNLRSQGRWITVYIELPEGYNVSDIDVSSIRLNETFSVDPTAPTQIGDYDSDGIPDLMVKFNRTELTSYLYNIIEVRLDTVALTVSGELTDGTPFEGIDTVRTRLAGDVNEDYVVDVIDLSMMGRSYGARIDEDRYEAEIDFNGDGIIDMREIIVISINYGATIPE